MDIYCQQRDTFMQRKVVRKTVREKSPTEPYMGLDGNGNGNGHASTP